MLSYVPDYGLSVSAGDDTSLEGLGLQWVGQLKPEEKISPELMSALIPGAPLKVVIEFYSDVDPGVAREIANSEGLVIQENPDLLPNHLLVQGAGDQLQSLAEWDEVSYVFPASKELIRGTPVRGCGGALTREGPVAQVVAIVNQGWSPATGVANVQYAFGNITQQLPTDAVESEIVRAFNEWSKYVQVTFSPTSDPTADQTIAVLFASGAHGDGYPFTGPGGVLAHTFYPVPTNPEPIAGDMHFNNDETWNIGADVDVFSIALHETGHALGLGHSDNPSDVMYPYYSMHTTLNQGDIAAIQQFYAAQGGTSRHEYAGSHPHPDYANPYAIPDACAAKSAAAYGLRSTQFHDGVCHRD